VIVSLWSSAPFTSDQIERPKRLSGRSPHPLRVRAYKASRHPASLAPSRGSVAVLSHSSRVNRCDLGKGARVSRVEARRVPKPCWLIPIAPTVGPRGKCRRRYCRPSGSPLTPANALEVIEAKVVSDPPGDHMVRAGTCRRSRQRAARPPCPLLRTLSVRARGPPPKTFTPRFDCRPWGRSPGPYFGASPAVRRRPAHHRLLCGGRRGCHEGLTGATDSRWRAQGRPG